MRAELIIALLRPLLLDIMPHLERIAEDSATEIDDTAVKVLKVLLGL